MATLATFPATPFETWPIHEFTYLEPTRCANTTVAQRRDWVEAYWAKADPAFTDGEGAESFLDFISPVQFFLNRLAEHPAYDIAVFSHGQFIKAVAWLIECAPQKIDDQAMALAGNRIKRSGQEQFIQERRKLFKLVKPLANQDFPE